MYIEAKSILSQLKNENRLLKQKIKTLLNENNDIYKLSFQTDPQSISISRLKDGRFILVNDAFVKLTGFSRKDVIGKTAKEVTIWHNSSDRIRYSEMLKKNGQVEDFETTMRFKDGSIRLVSLCARIIRYNKENCILTIGKDIQNQRQTESEYQKNKDHYKALFEDSSSIMLLIDPETGEIVNANGAACNFYGYTLREITAMNISNINILPVEQVKAELHLAKTSQKNHFFFKHRLANHEIRDVEVYSGNILFEGRELLYSIIHDISDRIKAEENLKNREAIIQAVIRNMPFDLWARDTNEVCFLQNESSERNWGKILGISVDQLQLPDETKKLWKSNNAKAYKGETVNEEIKCTDSFGREEFLQNIITPIKEDEKIIGILGFNFDISARKKSEEKVLKVLADMEAMINNTDDNIMIADKQGKPIMYNVNYAAFVEKILGMKMKEGMVPHKYLKEKEQEVFWDQIHKRVLSGEKFKEIFSIEIEGKRRCLEFSFHPVTDNNEVIGFAEHSRDITERIEYEKKLREAKMKAEESDQLKSAFLSNMSHEIRTPMNGIVGFAEMLKESNTDDEKRKLFTDAIIVSSRQLLRIVNDILDISKIETGQIELNKEPVDIDELIMEFYQQYLSASEKNKLEFQYEIANRDIRNIFDIDRSKLSRVLDNLLSNSFKFTKSGYVRFGYTIRSGYLEFYVKDTGVGIAPEFHEKVFQRFFREESKISYQYRGTGLGLSITKAYVECMGGTISLKSSPNSGSIFSFTIPMEPVVIGESEPKKQSKQKVSITDHPVTILIAEDEEMNFLYMKTVLSDENITILYAKNGQVAIELCRDHPEIDLILMDIKMPVVDGYEATKQIRKFRPDLPIIAQTAYIMSEDKNKAKQFGFNDYLTKPINYNVLKETILKHL